MSETLTAKRRVRKDDVDVIAAIFRELDQRQDLTPQRLLQLAEDPDSVLHKYFTWDDAKAATKYRLQEARWLLESIQINLTLPAGNTVTVNYALSVRGNEEGQDRRRYVLTNKAAKDQYLLEKVVEQAERELRGFVRKYQPYEALKSLLGRVEQAADDIRQGNAVG